MIYKVVAKKIRRMGGERTIEKFNIKYKETEKFPNDLMAKAYAVMHRLNHNPMNFNYNLKAV